MITSGVSAYFRSRRGCMVFCIGLMVSLVGLTYWHTKRVIIPQINGARENTLRRLARVHNTRIDPDSVVLRPLGSIKYLNRSLIPSTLPPPKNNNLSALGIKKPPATSTETVNQPPPNSNPIASTNFQVQTEKTQTNGQSLQPWPSAKQLTDLIPRPRGQNANCQKIFDNDPDEIAKIFDAEEEHKKVPVPDAEYEKLAGNCEEFKRSRGYVSHALSKEEQDFPLAYSIMMFKDVEQFERLLRSIYMPQNYYCIHVDVKSPEAVQKSVAAIANCFDNVFLASRPVNVEWASFTVVEADLICMDDLYKKSTKWRYFINLTGQEFPIKTNLELVQIFKVFNGAVNMEGTVQRRNVERTLVIHNGFSPVEPRMDKTPVPHNIRLTKGSVHVAVPREFVEYALYNPIAKDFREWVKDTGVPDETFFTSLGHSPHLGVPGAYKGEPETNKDSYPFIVRYKNWGTWPFDLPCAGQRVRMVCITSVGDLHIIKDRHELFVNKFYVDYSPSAYDCLEELHFQRMRDDVLGNRKLDLSFYQKLDFVKNHV